jgi:hypothetical protein
VTASSLSGRLDLCTVEGVSSGRRSLPDVFTGNATGWCHGLFLHDCCPYVCRFVHLSFLVGPFISSSCDLPQGYVLTRMNFEASMRTAKLINLQPLHHVVLTRECVLLCDAELPPGVCTSDSNCPSGSECNLKNATKVCRCSNGFDNCQPPPPTGFCQPKPQPLPPLSRYVTMRA